TDTMVANASISGATVEASYAWFVDGEQLSGPSTGKLDGNDWFVRGQVVHVEATFSEQTVASQEISVVNAPPTPPKLAFGGQVATQLDGDLQCLISDPSTDADEDDITYQFSWLANGVEFTNAKTTTLDGDTIGAIDTLNTTQWTCQVLASDGFSTGELASTSLILTPATPAVVLSPQTPATDDLVEASLTTAVPEGGSVTWSWTVNGIVMANTAQLDGSTFFNRGDVVAASAEVTDSFGSVLSLGSSSVIIVNTPPTEPEIELAGVTAQLEGNLVCDIATAAADADLDNVSYYFSWTVNGVAFDDAETTHWPDDTIGAVDTMSGSEFACQVVASDGTQYGTSVSKTIVLQTTAPTVEITTATPGSEDTIEATFSPGAPTDGELKWKWKVDGSAVTNNQDTLDETFFTKGQEVNTTVEVSDSFGASLSYDSNTVIVGNAPPQAPVVSIDFVESQLDADLRCVIDTDGSDIDGDTLTYSAIWTFNGQIYDIAQTTVFPSDTVPAIDTMLGSFWTCDVVANDGTEDSEAGTAAIGLYPRDPVAELSATDITVADTLEVLVDAPTPEGGTTTYQWYADSVLLSHTKSSIKGSKLAKGELVEAEVLIADGWGNSITLSTEVAEVHNTPPEDPGVAITAPQRQNEDDLLCVITES
ncbi:MAG: hypothetical protein HN348_28705, partial [Proteobacteria bacterium]|nr:hypothetical protein [Pseudomonadota bacterium]